jgi:hypothetical protein
MTDIKSIPKSESLPKEDLLNTAFYLDSSSESITRYINDSTSYVSVSQSNSYCIHNLNEQSAEKVIISLEIGSWILWIYKDDLINKKLNAITIRTDEGIIHHKDFLFQSDFQEPEVCEIDVEKTYIKNKNKLYAKKTYKTMKDYLIVLNKIYGLDLDKQVIYEDDNDFC